MAIAIVAMSRAQAGSFHASPDGARFERGRFPNRFAMRERRRGRWTAAILVALLTAPLPPRAAADGLAQWRSLPPALADRVLALSPSHISAADVRDILAHVPAPRVIALDGSVAFVSMARFAEFLVAMGYPEARLRDPRKGGLSQGRFTDKIG